MKCSCIEFQYRIAIVYLNIIRCAEVRLQQQNYVYHKKINFL